MAPDIWKVINTINYCQFFQACLFTLRMTCIKYKVCSKHKVHINLSEKSFHFRRRNWDLYFWDTTENNIPKIVDSSTGHILFCIKHQGSSKITIKVKLSPFKRITHISSSIFVLSSTPHQTPKKPKQTLMLLRSVAKMKQLALFVMASRYPKLLTQLS